MHSFNWLSKLQKNCDAKDHHGNTFTWRYIRQRTPLLLVITSFTFYIFVTRKSYHSHTVKPPRIKLFFRNVDLIQFKHAFYLLQRDDVPQSLRKQSVLSHQLTIQFMQKHTPHFCKLVCQFIPTVMFQSRSREREREKERNNFSAN